MTVVCSLGALVSVALLVSLIVVAVNNGSEDNVTTTSTTDAPEPGLDSLCLTPSCVEEASSVMSQMNQAANPYVEFLKRGFSQQLFILSRLIYFLQIYLAAMTFMNSPVEVSSQMLLFQTIKLKLPHSVSSKISLKTNLELSLASLLVTTKLSLSRT